MKKNKYAGWILFMIFSILFVLFIDYIMSNETPFKFKEGDDTEHLWRGDNGIEFYD